MEIFDRDTFNMNVSIRRLIASHGHKQFSESDVLIFHCPFDLAFLDYADTPSILYEHRAGRPTTFMFNEIMRLVEPIKRAVLIQDRPWVNSKLKELYEKADVIIVNSKFIKRTLKRYFGVDSFVVYPPVDLKRFRPTCTNPKRSYFLSVQRIDWQKRITMQIDAFKGLNKKFKLKIVGGSENHPNPDLVKYTFSHPKGTYDLVDSENIEVLGGVEEKDLPRLYTHAIATIQTGFKEDFGLVPIESMACGTPVICVDEGGFKETVHSSSLGVRIKPPYVQSLRKTVETFDNSNYDQAFLRKEAEKYSLERFENEMRKYVELAVERHAVRRC